MQHEEQFEPHPNTSNSQLRSSKREAHPTQRSKRMVRRSIRRLAAAIQEHSERQTRWQEPLYRALAQHIPNGSVALFDHELRYLLCAGEKLMTVGLEAEAMVGQSIWQVFPPEIAQQIEPQYRAALSGETVIQEVQYEQKFYETRAVPVFNQAGEISWGMVLTQNITDRKQIERSLRDSEERNQLAMTTAQMFSFECNVLSGEVKRSKNCSTILGLAAEEAEVDTIQNYFQRVHPDDRTAFIDQIQALTSEQATYKMAYRLIRPDQQEIVLEESGRAFFDEQGQIVRLLGMTANMTQRKQAEERLAQTNSILRAVIDGTSDVIFVKDLQGRYVIANSAIADWFRCSIDQVLGQDDTALFPPEIAQQVQHTDRQVMETQVALTLEEQIPKQEQFRSLLTTKYPWRDAEGKVLGVIGISRDISDRKAAELAIQRSEQQVRRVLDSLFSFVGIMTPNGTLLEANRTALTAAELQPADVMGKPFWNAYWWSFSTESQAQLQQAIQQAAAGQSVRYDAQVRLSEDRFIVIDFAIVPLLDAAGRVEYLIPSGIDITERQQTEAQLRKSESRLRGFVESNIIGILFGDVEGGILEANDEFLRIVGYSREELEAGQIRWTALTPPEYLPLDAERIAEAQERGACTPYEKEYIRKDGTRVPVLIGYNLFETERNRSVAFILDIRERKQLEQTLRQQTSDLAQANRLKDEFLAILSHELKTPLNPILGWTKLLQGGRLNADQQQQALATIERNAKLQAQLVNDLLDISCILRGKLSLKFEPVTLIQPISAAIDTIRLAAEAKSLTLETRLDAIAAQVYGDSSRLQQIVGNLLSNAIKFTPQNGQISIRLEEVDDQIQIQIRDTGKGIRADFLPNVFERFRQEDGSTTRKYGGLGLGLAIVKQLVEAHGGTVEAQSAGEGQGSTFTVRLPLFSRAIAQHSTHHADALLDLGGIRILMIDDDRDSLEFAAFVLEQAGAIVTAVSTAAEVRHHLLQSDFDLLVSDIGMPEVDGYTLLKQVRELPNGKDLSAIAFTAYTGEVNQQQAIAAGFQGHLGKPLDPVELVATVKKQVIQRSSKSIDRSQC
ncbi:MAG: PAS domain-containing protein [Leptolyngbya sp. Prado105]|jgi:PAS domain S-box-containing protein|nr:PAS domain-containing protein [Leptolyngbya sp. Prado105]